MSNSTARRNESPAATTSDPEVVAFRAQFDARSSLDTLVREGAQRMLQAAIESEVEEFIAQHAGKVDENGKRLVVRNGYLPAREVVTGAGALEIQQPRARDNDPNPDTKARFAPSIIPQYMRKSPSIEELIPVLYLLGVSTGDFTEALEALTGKEVSGFSANTVVRLKDKWADEQEEWSKRSLKGKHYPYIWVDGIHVNVRLEAPECKRQCILVVMGATLEGKKELIAVQDGYRESEPSWNELLADLKTRGLEKPPELAVGDGALGFWAALRKVFPKTREQRCWATRLRTFSMMYRSRSKHE